MRPSLLSIHSFIHSFIQPSLHAHSFGTSAVIAEPSTPLLESYQLVPLHNIVWFDALNVSWSQPGDSA
jgi:hypothetical protein